MERNNYGPPYYGLTKEEYNRRVEAGEPIPKGLPTRGSDVMTIPNKTGTPPLPTAGEYGGNIIFEGQSIGQISYAEWGDFEGLSQADKEEYISEHFGTDVSGQVWSASPAGMITQQQIEQIGQGPDKASTTPTFGEGAAAGIPLPVVTPAPAYEISPELQEAMDLYGDTLTDWVTSGGYGLSPEVQAQMIQQQSDMLKGREAENIRVMKNNMERRGITNSGFLQSAENQIHSNTTVDLAGAIADVQIKSALMKMASFEKGMGAMAQFLGFLSEQSQLAYQPEFATWQAEQMATMQHWQAQMDVYKMELNQSYQTQNLQLQAQLESQLNEQQHEYDIELAGMEIEAAQEMAKQEATGSISGSLVTGLFAIGAAVL